MLSTARPRSARLDRSTVRFNITRQGSRRIVEHQRKRRYRELLREMPHWDAPLACIQGDDGDWMIVARIEPSLTHGRPQLAETQLASGWCWDSEAKAHAHLDEHAEELRDELVADLFTMGICTRCEAVVPVFGDYVAFGPAGLLVCGPCRTEDECDPAEPAILHL